MIPDIIPAHRPRVLTQAQRPAYFATGYPATPGLIPTEWLQRLKALFAECIELSRTREKSDEAFDLGPRHTAAAVAHRDPTPCPVRPDWSRRGYGSIFGAQRATM